jgi:hypothetical protein
LSTLDPESGMKKVESGTNTPDPQHWNTDDIYRLTTKSSSLETVPSEKVHNLGVENSTVVQVSRVDGDVNVDLT